MVLAERCAARRCRIHERMSPSTSPTVVGVPFVPIPKRYAPQALRSRRCWRGDDVLAAQSRRITRRGVAAGGASCGAMRPPPASRTGEEGGSPSCGVCRARPRGGTRRRRSRSVPGRTWPACNRTGAEHSCRHSGDQPHRADPGCCRCDSAAKRRRCGEVCLNLNPAGGVPPVSRGSGGAVPPVSRAARSNRQGASPPGSRTTQSVPPTGVRTPRAARSSVPRSVPPAPPPGTTSGSADCQMSVAAMKATKTPPHGICVRRRYGDSLFLPISATGRSVRHTSLRNPRDGNPRAADAPSWWPHPKMWPNGHLGISNQKPVKRRSGTSDAAVTSGGLRAVTVEPAGTRHVLVTEPLSNRPPGTLAVRRIFALRHGVAMLRTVRKLGNQTAVGVHPALGAPPPNVPALVRCGSRACVRSRGRRPPAW